MEGRKMVKTTTPLGEGRVQILDKGLFYLSYCHKAVNSRATKRWGWGGGGGGLKNLCSCEGRLCIFHLLLLLF